ncbi:hypothetical protein SBOR_8938 [Sclerotinia borealis F-4128]|uniref:Uncharacterized protein n=1 Tax=Sclerotinia borealis (strain F-4128) TaxID=1432307 RepID=W9C460_SCLBF|nr:hypothetical protein SBOR_8938 [Sclerotinia borealis F-4128]
MDSLPPLPGCCLCRVTIHQKPIITFDDLRCMQKLICPPWTLITNKQAQDLNLRKNDVSSNAVNLHPPFTGLNPPFEGLGPEDGWCDNYIVTEADLKLAPLKDGATRITSTNSVSMATNPFHMESVFTMVEPSYFAGNYRHGWGAA